MAAPRTENVILVTLDGVRIEELFAGMDPAIAASTAEDGYSDIEVARDRYWHRSAAERRLALMPFFWGTLAPQGVVLGNPELGSRVKVRNAIKWSSPGYIEIMTGMPQAERWFAIRTGRSPNTSSPSCISRNPASRSSGPGMASSLPLRARTMRLS
jgi:hypothetical protein